MKLSNFFTTSNPARNRIGIRVATLTWMVGAVVLVMPAALLAEPKGPPESVPVEVVNVPLPVIGDIEANVTGEVMVTNFPAVQEVSGNVNASVTGEVNIANTPDVNVANAPLDVLVLNAPPWREPFQESTFELEAGGSSAEVRFDPVPAGKLLEIKHVSSFTLLEKGSFMYCTVMVIEPGEDTDTVVGRHHVIVTPQSGEFKDQYVASTPITLFADAGQEVEYECTFSSQSDSLVLQVSLSGFLTEN